MKILVTGAGGFVGQYLVKELIKRKHDVVAIGINNGAFLKAYDIPIYEVNILDFESVKECLQKEQPDGVIHLAAQSNVHASWERPKLTVDVNVTGTIHMFKAVAEVCPEAKFLNIGSSDEYGLTAKQGIPLSEDMPCLPQNPYSISKLCAEQMILQFGKKYGVNVVQARPFNHFGPGQQKGFVVSDFSSQIAMIETGKIEPVLRVGNLDSWRDFTFVQDVVYAYILLIESPNTQGIYNICSGHSRKIIDILHDLVDLSKVKIDVVCDIDKVRPVDVPFFVGNAERLKQDTNWSLQTNFLSGLESTLNWWRQIS